MAVAVLPADSRLQTPPLPRLGEARSLFSEWRATAEANGHDEIGVKLRRTYLRLALQFHPDKRPESERIAATQLFQAIAAVYEELTRASDPQGGGNTARVKSPVAAAAELGDLSELLRLLRMEPYMANEPDDLGVFPLMFAAAGGNVDAAELLLDFGADLHAVNPIKWSVLLYAALGNHESMVRFLVRRGHIITDHDLILAAYTGNPSSLEALLELYRGCVAELRTDESRKTLLHLACEGMCFLRHSAERHAKCVDLVLKCGVPPNVAEPKKGRTCLQDYVSDVRWRTRNLVNSNDHMRVLEQLCLNGASVTVEDVEGENALSLATEMGLPPVREVLLCYV